MFTTRNPVCSNVYKWEFVRIRTISKTPLLVSRQEPPLLFIPTCMVEIKCCTWHYMLSICWKHTVCKCAKSEIVTRPCCLSLSLCTIISSPCSVFCLLLFSIQIIQLDSGEVSLISPPCLSMVYSLSRGVFYIRMRAFHTSGETSSNQCILCKAENTVRLVSFARGWSSARRTARC